MSIHYSKARKRYFICYKVVEDGKQRTVSIYSREWTKERGKKYVKAIEQQAIEDDIRKRRLRLKRGETVTFRELLDQIEADWSSSFKRGTAYHKTHIAEKYASEMLPASRPASECLRPDRLRKFKDEVSRLPLTAQWRNRILGNMRAIVSFAAEREYISFEAERKLLACLKPIAEADGPSARLSYWTDEEWERFISTFEADDRFRMLFEVTYACGLRFGELLALRWEDFDPEARTLSVTKSIDASGVVSTPKTPSSNATVSLPAGLSSRLEEYRKGFAAVPNEAMFFADGRTSRTTVRRVMKAHIEMAGVPFIRFHGLRHSCATHLIHMGVSPLIVSKHLRHSSVKETLDTYSHVFPNETAEAIDRFFK